MTERPHTSRPVLARSQLGLLALGLFVLIVGARWALYNRYGTDLPEWDQWDAEGLMIFYPLSIGHFHYLTDFWKAHNEHRVALTRFVAWALTEANGQWDQRLEAAVNALLPATIGISFLCLSARRLSWNWLAGLCGLIAALYALPVASQNILSGFDSQQFFLIGLAIGAIATLPFAEPYSRRWWAGSAFVLLSLGSMGSGFFAAAVVGAMLVFQVWCGERELRSVRPGLIVCGLALAVGVMTRSVNPGHDVLRAQSAGDFALTAAKEFGWPAFDVNWGYGSLLLYVPWALVAARTLNPRRRCVPGWNDFLSGLGLWVGLQILATAYARGAGGPSPASRYVDTLVVGLLVNLLCLHSLWVEGRGTHAERKVLRGLVIGWTGLVAIGTAAAANNAFAAELPPEVSYHYYCEQNVRNYLITKDESYLRHDEIPYPAEWSLKAILDYPGIAKILPVSTRVPIALAASSGAEPNELFQRNDSRVPERLSRLPRSGFGLPPAAPVLANAVTWGSFGAKKDRGPALWRSRPIQIESGRWLKFETAGDFGHPGIRLELRDAVSDRLLATVAPDKTPGNSWRSAYAHAPRTPFVISARDETKTGWMAFSEPIEIGTGSYWCWRAIRHGRFMAAVAGLLAIGVLAAARRKP